MAVIWCFPAMKMNLRQWSSCKEMVFVCVIWSFDDMELGKQVILSDKKARDEILILCISLILQWSAGQLQEDMLRSMVQM